MMRTLLVVLVVFCFVTPPSAQSRRTIDRAVEVEVMQLLDAFFDAFNRSDLVAQERMMHFPHYRLAGGLMTVLERPGTQSRIVPLEQEWHHTKWDRREVVGWSNEKIHVNAQFTRYRKDGTPISSFESLYVLTKEDGRWGIKMRSSFAP